MRTHLGLGSVRLPGVALGKSGATQAPAAGDGEQHGERRSHVQNPKHGAVYGREAVLPEGGK